MTHLTLYNKDTLIYYSDNITLMTLPWLAHATKLIDQYYLHHNRLLLFWVWKHLKNRWTHVECGAVVLPNHNVYTFGVNTNLKLYLCPRVSSTATFPCFAASHNIQFLKGVWNTYHWGTKSLWEVVSVATKHGKEAELYAKDMGLVWLTSICERVQRIFLWYLSNCRLLLLLFYIGIFFIN